MTELNQRIRHIEIPQRMAHLPIDERGWPVPYFVPMYDGKWEFRGFDGDKLAICVRHRRCWLCGKPMGRYLCFPIGPMCCVTRTISEPASHYECAKYGAMACPFLTQPRARRNEKDMPPDASVAGIGIMRNPGVIALWTTLTYKLIRVNNGSGVLFRIGAPERIEYWAEGRIATRDEIMHSIETGLPILRAQAATDGGDAPQQLEWMINDALKLVPA